MIVFPLLRFLQSGRSIRKQEIYPFAVAVYLILVGCGGTLASEQSEAAVGKTFVCNAIGSQYWYCPIGLEFMGSWWSHGKVLGHQLYFTEPDEKNNEVLVLWGSNSYVSHQMADARKIIRRFSQDPEKMVITVDPRLSETAQMSDLHIPLKNGTDSLFLRASISLILKITGSTSSIWTPGPAIGPKRKNGLRILILKGRCGSAASPMGWQMGNMWAAPSAVPPERRQTTA